MRTKIGRATIEYNEVGKVIGASFTPTMNIILEPNVLMQMGKVKDVKDVDVIKSNAELALASWFSKNNEIELADRDHYEIASETVECETHQNGNVKKCVIEFVFKTLDHA